jgi:hypothetical protein
MEMRLTFVVVATGASFCNFRTSSPKHSEGSHLESPSAVIESAEGTNYLHVGNKLSVCVEQISVEQINSTCLTTMLCTCGRN